MIIKNGKDTPLNVGTGTIPYVGDALTDWFQPMAFELVDKSSSGFQVVEVGTVFNFIGVIQPFSERQLMIKPEGERAWSWFWVHADPSLILQVDDVITYRTIQFRVKSKKNYDIYGYVEYQIIQDWTGSGPSQVMP